MTFKCAASTSRSHLQGYCCGHLTGSNLGLSLHSHRAPYWGHSPPPRASRRSPGVLLTVPSSLRCELGSPWLPGQSPLPASSPVSAPRIPEGRPVHEGDKCQRKRTGISKSGPAFWGQHLFPFYWCLLQTPTIRPFNLGHFTRPTCHRHSKIQSGCLTRTTQKAQTESQAPSSFVMSTFNR